MAKSAACLGSGCKNMLSSVGMDGSNMSVNEGAARGFNSQEISYLTPPQGQLP
jgi:hypothetical protein